MTHGPRNKTVFDGNQITLCQVSGKFMVMFEWGRSDTPRHWVRFTQRFLTVTNYNFAGSAALAEVCALLSAILVSVDVSRMETSLSKPDSLTLRRT